MEEDYKNNPIYQQGLKDGYKKALADFREMLTKMEVNQEIEVGVVARTL